MYLANINLRWASKMYWWIPEVLVLMLLYLSSSMSHNHTAALERFSLSSFAVAWCGNTKASQNCPHRSRLPKTCMKSENSIIQQGLLLQTDSSAIIHSMFFVVWGYCYRGWLFACMTLSWGNKILTVGRCL